MRKIQEITLAAAMMFVMAGDGHCEFRDGNELLAQCTIDTGATTNGMNDPAKNFYQEDAFCTGYIMAIADASACNSNDGANVKGYSCRESEAIGGVQIVNMVIRWLNVHPGRLSGPAVGLVADVLQDASHC